MDLLDKGDLKVNLEKGVLEIEVGQEGKVKNTLELHLGYVLDKLEEAIPGDQKGLFAGAKALLGLT